MKLSKFRYKLPPELIAQHPSANRDECRLMVVDRKTGTIEHKVFKDVIDYFDEKDVFVFNDTKVFPARLYGNKEKTGAEIEVFLLRELNRDLRIWDVLVDPARKIRIGNKLYFGEDDSLVAEVIDNTTSRGRTLRFLFDGEYDEFKKLLYGLGETPLPASFSFFRGFPGLFRFPQRRRIRAATPRRIIFGFCLFRFVFLYHLVRNAASAIARQDVAPQGETHIKNHESVVRRFTS